MNFYAWSCGGFFHCQIHRSRRAEQTDGHECRLRDTAFLAAGNALVIDGQNYTDQRYDCEPAHSRQNNILFHYIFLLTVTCVTPFGIITTPRSLSYLQLADSIFPRSPIRSSLTSQVPAPSPVRARVTVSFDETSEKPIFLPPLSG